MSNEANQGFQISQGFFVAQPKSCNALPIPITDWSNLKSAIKRLDTESSWFKDSGLLLIGAGISTLITIFTGTFAIDRAAKYLPVAWSAAIIALVVGFCCLLFAWKFKKIVRARADDVVVQMEQIEQRYEYKG
jgi:hypothetical protein